MNRKFTKSPVLAESVDSDFIIDRGVLVEYLGSSVNVKIPDGVTVIGEDVFKRNTKLQSVEIPDSVTIIGPGAFIDCTNLTSVKLPNSIEHINEYAFCGCTMLEDINIPETVKTIGYAAFKYVPISDDDIPVI